MDINYYLEREQIERMRAARATNANARAAHEELAARYRERINAHRLELGAAPMLTIVD